MAARERVARMKPAFFLLWALPAFAAPTKSDAALAKLQAAWDETKSYQAEFTQTVKSKGTGLTEDPSEGTLSVIKPDKLRWEDRTAKTTQILNGDEHWDITENTRRKSRTVTYTPNIHKVMGKSALAILSGRGKFKDYYQVKLVSETPKEAVLRLVPKTDSNETLIAKIDKNGYVLRSLTTEAQDSQVVLEFKKIQRNATFPEKHFSYEKQPNDVFQTRKE